ncbi:MAG: diguanylate cyclase domain-containing protein [Woeseiaceae bacterium]
MTEPDREVLEQLIESSAEPVFIARIDHPDWPVVLSNAAFGAISDYLPVRDKPLADVVENLVGRELALEISETVRGGHETTIAVELGSREYLLVLKPLASTNGEAQFYAVYWRGTAGGTLAVDTEIQQALLKAKRRIRDLTRDDPVTGLLNAATFNEVLTHDWAVAAREKSSLALVAFTLDDFPAYLEVFGKHASDSCLRRVAQATRRCLRRASDVAARLETEDGDFLVVLSHSSNESGVNDFAARISAAVRELGLHHPRSRQAKFVTVSYRTRVQAAGEDDTTAEDFLDQVLS